jgi:hypothetical protein
VLDLEDDWAALHVTLTAEPPIPKPVALQRGISWKDDSLENALMGGRPTALKSGDPTARWLSPAEVARVAAELVDIDDARLREIYDEELLDEYDLLPIGLERLLERFRALRSFYARAASRDQSVLIQIV